MGSDEPRQPAESEPSFIYLDSNVYSTMCDDVRDYDAVVSYVNRMRLTVMVSTTLLAEKHQANRQHIKIARFWRAVGARLMEPYTWMMRRELDDYPSPRIEFPHAVETVGELRSLDEQTIISQLLAGGAAARMDRSLRENAAQVAERFHKNLGNFAPDPATRTYTARQLRDFTDRWIIEQDIKVAFPQHPNIHLLRPPLPERSFLSSRMHTSLVFWKYYLGQRKPKKLSDLGDRGHTTLFPYCTEIVTEKDQANIVGQLRRRVPSLFLAEGRTLTMTDFFAKARDPNL